MDWEQTERLVQRVRKSDEEKIIRVGVRFGRVGSSQHVKSGTQKSVE